MAKKLISVFWLSTAHFKSELREISYAAGYGVQFVHVAMKSILGLHSAKKCTLHVHVTITFPHANESEKVTYMTHSFFYEDGSHQISRKTVNK